MMGRAKGFAAALLCLAAAGARADDLAVRIAGPMEIVYSYGRDRCDARAIPDTPARALRRADGSVALVAGHFRNRVLVGPTFDALRPVCGAVSAGAESADPSAFDDRFWIQALAPLPGGEVLALASHEYMGSRHPGACQVKPPGGGPACWYFAIVAAVAREDELVFRLQPRDRRLVAAPIGRYDGDGRTRGVLTTSNIAFRGDHAYVLAWTEDGALPGGRGHCLLRAPRTDLLGGWEVLSGGRYRPAGDPYAVGGALGCDSVGAGRLVGKVRSMVFVETRGVWLAVFATRRPGRPGEPGFGVYTSVSRDLVGWSEPNHLAAYEPFWGAGRCGVFYEYPSLIDHGSPSAVFDTAGRDLHLYMTRLNWERCDKIRMNRDLVRLRLELDGP